MDDEKNDADYIEKAYDAPVADDGRHPDQDWTPEEEKAIVYVAHEDFIRTSADTFAGRKQTFESSQCSALSLVCRCLIGPISLPRTLLVSGEI